MMVSVNTHGFDGAEYGNLFRCHLEERRRKILVISANNNYRQFSLRCTWLNVANAWNSSGRVYLEKKRCD